MKILSKNQFRKGFTLVELLVAMAITVILVSLVVVITGSALDAWRAARNEIRASHQAKIMLDALGKDLESLVVRKNNNYEWLYVTSETTEIGPVGQPSPNAATLVFLTSATDRYDGNLGVNGDDEGGDISAVGYHLEFRDPIFDDQDERYSTFVLYRNLINPDQAFQGLLAAEDLEQAYSAASAGRTEQRNFMCENIYQISVIFNVEYVDESDEKVTVRVPVMSSGTGANAVSQFSITGDGIRTDNSTPRYSDGRVVSVDLGITVLSDTGMRTLRTRTFNDVEQKAKFLTENSYPYTKRIVIPQP
ncbi:MAG: PulJ/GspJ family protein [Verrucomicrobiaceae bacterium]